MGVIETRWKIFLLEWKGHRENLFLVFDVRTDMIISILGNSFALSSKVMKTTDDSTNMLLSPYNWTIYLSISNHIKQSMTSYQSFKINPVVGNAFMFM